MWLKLCDQNFVTKTLWQKFCDQNFVLSESQNKLGSIWTKPKRVLTYIVFVFLLIFKLHFFSKKAEVEFLLLKLEQFLNICSKTSQKKKVKKIYLYFSTTIWTKIVPEDKVFLPTSSFGHISAPRQDFSTLLIVEVMPKPRSSEFRSKFRVFCSETLNSEQNSEFRSH